MSGCVLYPSAYDKVKGTEVNSPLFLDMLKYTGNRHNASTLYNKYAAEGFQELINDKDRNQFGEISLIDFLSRTNAIDIIDKEVMIKSLLKEIAGLDMEKEHSFKDILNGISKVNDSSFGTAILLDVIPNNGNYSITMEHTNKDLVNRTKEIKATYNLMRDLSELVAKHGFRTEYIDSIEEDFNKKGSVEFKVARNKAEEFTGLIKVSKGDLSAYVEEHSHAILALLGNHPLVSRLREYVTRDDLYRTILGDEFEEYSKEYDGNDDLLIEEAMGKLVTEAILNRSVPLANRLVSNVFNRLSEINSEELNNIIKAADDLAGFITDSTFRKALEKALSVQHIKVSRQLFKIKTSIDNYEKAYEKVLDVVVKKKKIEEAGGHFSKLEDISITSSQDLFKVMYDYGKIGEYNNAIISYLNTSTTSLANILSYIKTVKYSDSDLKTKASVLLTFKSILDSSEEAFRILNELGTNITLSPMVSGELSSFRRLIDESRVLFDGILLQINEESLSEFVQNKDEVFTKDGDTYSLRDLLQEAPYEVGEITLYLRSLAQSGEPILQLIDKLTRKYSKRAYLEANDFRRRVLALGEEYRQKGLTDLSFLRSKTLEDGVPKYVAKYKLAEFKEGMYGARKKSFIEGNPSIYEQWLKENTIDLGNGRILPNSKYFTDEYNSLTPIQKEFRDKFIELKQEADAALPNRALGDGYNAIAIRKDLVERLKTNGIVDTAKTVQEVFQIVSDDVDMLGHTLNKFVGFDGRKIVGVPIYFHKKNKNDKVEDLSTDEISNLISYGAMATNYRNMREGANLVELLMISVKNRKTIDRSSGRKIVETIEEDGRVIHNTAYTTNNNAYKMLETFVDRMYYGMGMSNKVVKIGDKSVNLSKAAKSLGALDGVMRMSLSVLNSAVNLINGKIPIITEALATSLHGKGLFGVSDYIKASSIYHKEIPKMLGELSNPIKKSKLSLVSELFDISQKERGHFLQTDFAKKWYEKFNIRHLAFLQEAGEHALAHETAISVMLGYKLKDSSGKEISLWEALEVEYIDPKNKSLGAKLVLKNGVTKLDGSEFSMNVDSKDILEMSEKIGETNRYLQGIYNNQDKNKLNASHVGSLMLMYRKWMVPFFNRRFGESMYNYNLGEDVEGYYRSAGSFMWGIIKDLAKLKFSISANYKALSDTEQKNIIKAGLEMAVLALITMMIGLLWDDEDDTQYKDRAWISLTSEYVMRRVALDMQFYTPNFNMFSAIKKTVSSPMVALGTVDGIVSIGNLIWDTATLQLFDEVERGRYKGDIVLKKDLMNIPPFVMWKTIENAYHPEYLIPYAKNEM